jgi:putative membrane protein
MRNPLPLVLLAGLTGSLAIAQDNPAPSGTPIGQTQPSTDRTPPAQPGAAGQATPTSQATSPTARQMSDQTFVREASAAGLAEVADAQAALQSATRADVRKAAQQILADHTAANEKLRSLAQKKNMALAAAPATRPAVPATGDFDSAYVAAQIKAHQSAIALFQAEAANGSDSDLRAFATATLPTLQQHLAMMQSLQ